jgi:mRNA-degrading endonuclease toxin of MazEF toxin-antitoxin module
MNYNSGDIVHINFPFTEGDTAHGQARFKARPALVVTDADSNGDCVTVALTSKSHHAHCLEMKASDLASGQLTQTSYARADKLFTINAQAVQAKRGVAKPAFMARVRSLLCPAVGCK